MKPWKEQAIQESLDKVLEGLEPELADVVRRKWAEDQEKFSACARENLPSEVLEFWADRSCRDCHGRGRIGTNIQLVSGGKSVETPIKCRCTNKNYQKWLAQFRRYYNALRDISKANGHEV